MNLDKLTPAPWPVEKGEIGWLIPKVRFMDDRTDCDFIALARSAFDVMTRRYWTVWMDGGGYWIAVTAIDNEHMPIIRSKSGEVCWYTGLFCDPFTALVEADKWYRENVEERNPKEEQP